MSIVSALIGIAIFPQQATAHFVLETPESWMVQSQIGDPQKPAPCGIASAQDGTPSNTITKVAGGRKLRLKVSEMIYHPGHYRVALAVNGHTELPPDPETTTRETPRGPWSVSAVIQNPAPMVSSRIPHPRRRHSKPRSTFRTSTARNARCR